MNALEAHNHFSLIVDSLAVLPQAEMPVEHFIHGNVYTRQVFMKGGTLAVGHHQKHEHLNVVISGKVVMFCDDGVTRLVEAPLIFVGKPGRKFGFVVEDTVWLNIYATNGETDIEKLEDTFLNKSLLPAIHLPSIDIAAQKDFELLGIKTPQSCDDDFCNIDIASQSKISFRPSGIHGYGVFLSAPVPSGNAIAPVSLNGIKTVVMKYLNHSPTPNCDIRTFGTNRWLVALQPINGCIGGNYGTEITVNYRVINGDIL